MFPTKLDAEGSLLFSSLISKLPLWLADYSSPMRIVRAKSSDDTQYYALQNYNLMNFDSWLIGWKLQQPNPNIPCFISDTVATPSPSTNTTEVLNILTSLGFNYSSVKLDSSDLVVKLYQDGTWYALYKVTLTGEIPSTGVIEYISKSHNCTITVDGNILSVIQNSMPVFPPPKTSTYESRESYDLRGPEIHRLPNWKAYSILHFNENIHLLGYPVKIDLNKIQWSDSHEVYRIEWLDKVPPKELLDHVFCNTCYTIFIFSEDTTSYRWAISVNKWGEKEPVTYILNDWDKCDCRFCDKLRKDKHYKPAIMYTHHLPSNTE